MVVPLIATGARTAGAATRRSPSNAHIRTRRSRTLIPTRTVASRRENDTRNRIREQQSNLRSVNYEMDSESSSIIEISGEILKKIKAVRASWVIALFILPFYPIQLAFGIIQIAGFSAEYVGEQFLWGFGAVLIPGQTVFAAGLVVTILFGLVSMFAAAFIYTLNGVSWWRGFGLISFLVFTVFYFLPILNIFPWVVGWMFVVIYAQKKH